MLGRNLKSLSAWVDAESRKGWWTFATALFASIGILLLALNAWQLNSKFAIVGLTALALMWMGFALMNGRSWRRTIRDWGSTIECWKETGHLMRDVTSLLDEALSDLSTWDREKAEDISMRATTVMKMREQNIDRILSERRPND